MLQDYDEAYLALAIAVAIPYLHSNRCMTDSCCCFWWIWTTKLRLDKSHQQDVGRPARFENAKIIYTIVVSRYRPYFFLLFDKMMKEFQV